LHSTRSEFKNVVPVTNVIPARLRAETPHFSVQARLKWEVIGNETGVPGVLEIGPGQTEVPRTYLVIPGRCVAPCL